MGAEVFWAGLIGAVAGSVAGVLRKRRDAPRAPIEAMAVAAVVFIVITAVAAVAS